MTPAGGGGAFGSGESVSADRVVGHGHATIAGRSRWNPALAGADDAR
jgi:hypothetical protein